MLCRRRRFPSVLPSINPSATGWCRMGRRPRGVSGTNLIFLCLTGNFETELASLAPDAEGSAALLKLSLGGGPLESIALVIASLHVA